MEREQLERAIEAILFAAGERVDAHRLATVLERDENEILEIREKPDYHTPKYFGRMILE